MTTEDRTTAIDEAYTALALAEKAVETAEAHYEAARAAWMSLDEAPTATVAWKAVDMARDARTAAYAARESAMCHAYDVEGR